MQRLSVAARAAGVVCAVGVTGVALAALGAALSPTWNPRKLPDELRYESLPPVPDIGEGEPKQVGIARHDLRVSVHGTTVDTTVLVPQTSGPKPGLVLVHGAGPRTRSDLMERAEYFAHSGIVTVVYDKRTKGYSTATSRDFELLADDVLAMVDLLREREDVDPTRIGLWGISEGAGWVVPIAAARAPDRVSFVILVSAPTMSPAEQMVWWVEKGLRRIGAPTSMRRAVAVALSSGRSGAFGAFDYVTFDPRPFMENISQPVLAVYGAEDRTIPVAQATRQLSDALQSSGNDAYTILVFPGADHGLYTDGGDLVSGYREAMVEWIHRLPDVPESISGHVFGAAPDQHLAMPELPSIPWYGTFAGQLSLLGVAVLAYFAGPLSRIAGRRRRRGTGLRGEASWQPIRRLLRRVGWSAISLHVLLPLCLMGGIGLALATIDLTWAVNVVWLLVRLLGLGCLVSACVAGERVIAELGAGWRPDGVQVVSLAGTLVGTALLLVLAAYWGMFAPAW